jgi:hypothetical protein
LTFVETKVGGNGGRRRERYLLKLRFGRIIVSYKLGENLNSFLPTQVDVRNLNSNSAIESQRLRSKIDAVSSSALFLIDGIIRLKCDLMLVAFEMSAPRKAINTFALPNCKM